jgi:cell division protein FtsI/penicillin-binding protein 2
MNENDDRVAGGSNLSTVIDRRAQRTDAFDSISPLAANFALDSITSPRDYISLLFGGGTNLWSNVDFAAAFGTCVTGQPVIAHLAVNQDAPKFLESRERFPEIAAKLRAGLSSVVTEGTARTPLQESGALSYLSGLRGIKVYAKTGTLQAQANAPETSRLVIALIRWENEGQGTVKKGIIISIVGEKAEVGTAAKWLGEFLIKNRTSIERLL